MCFQRPNPDMVPIGLKVAGVDGVAEGGNRGRRMWGRRAGGCIRPGS